MTEDELLYQRELQKLQQLILSDRTGGAPPNLSLCATIAIRHADSLLEIWQFEPRPVAVPLQLCVALASLQAAVRSFLHFSPLARWRRIAGALPLQAQQEQGGRAVQGGGSAEGIGRRLAEGATQLFPYGLCRVEYAAGPPPSLAPLLHDRDPAALRVARPERAPVATASSSSSSSSSMHPLGAGYFGVLRPGEAALRDATSGKHEEQQEDSEPEQEQEEEHAATPTAASSTDESQDGVEMANRAFAVGMALTPRPLAVAGSPDPRRRTERPDGTAISPPKAIPQQQRGRARSSPLGRAGFSTAAVSPPPPPVVAEEAAEAAAAAPATAPAVSSRMSPLGLGSRFRGNIEESLLQGAVPSGTPTTVQGFTAKLGATGLGSVPSQVKLPLSVTFYQLAHSDLPTPYVGTIDLERDMKDGRPAGHYAVPKAGHVQVIVCNPEKTGLKVFLVPYNFSDMPARTHTFLRQRTLMQVPARRVGGKVVELEKRVLVFAIHLKFTCNKAGKLFLHRSIKVVFAGTAPDREARLDTIVEGPRDPVYSPWSRAGSGRAFSRGGGLVSGGDVSPVSPVAVAAAAAAASVSPSTSSSSSSSSLHPRNHRKSPVRRPGRDLPSSAKGSRMMEEARSVPFLLDADGCCVEGGMMVAPAVGAVKRGKSPTKAPMPLGSFGAVGGGGAGGGASRARLAGERGGRARVEGQGEAEGEEGPLF